MSDEFDRALQRFVEDFHREIDERSLTPRDVCARFRMVADYAETIGDRLYDLGNEQAAVASWAMANHWRDFAETFLTREPQDG